MRLSAFMAGLVLAAALSVADSSPVSAQTQSQTKEPVKVEIQPGDTLTKIAQQHETTYIRLYNANENIEHPDLIYPGEQVRVPAPDEQLKDRPFPQETPKPAVQPARPAAKPAVKPRPSAPKAQPRTVSQPRTAAAPAAASGGVWDRLAQCESGGNWSINTGNGYYGGLQFTLSSWRAVGGGGYPHHASKAEQIARAEKLLAIQGWGAWPACTKKLGLR